MFMNDSVKNGSSTYFMASLSLGGQYERALRLCKNLQHLKLPGCQDGVAETIAMSMDTVQV